MRRGRATVLRLHLIVALLAGAGLLLVSVSGAALIFRPELDDAVFGLPAGVAAGGVRAPLAVLLDAGQAAHPGLNPLTLTLPERDGRHARLALERGASRETVEVLLDPVSARVLGSRWLERSPLHALRVLHTELYLGARGRLLVAALGALLLLQAATGLFLWWPFTRRLPRGFTVRRGRRWPVLSFDLHKVVGFVSLAFHVPLALTGALLALPVGAAPARPGSVEIRERDGTVARLDRATGALTVVRDPRRAADRLWGLMTTLHEGRFGGLASRSLYVAAGLSPVVLALTGLGIWLTRPRPRRGVGTASSAGSAGAILLGGGSEGAVQAPFDD
jgi:uncharacterized iron-regulated membrane protein